LGGVERSAHLGFSFRRFNLVDCIHGLTADNCCGILKSFS
jgi:hypothetical protein